MGTLSACFEVLHIIKGSGKLYRGNEEWEGASEDVQLQREEDEDPVSDVPGLHAEQPRMQIVQRTNLRDSCRGTGSNVLHMPRQLHQGDLERKIQTHESNVKQIRKMRYALIGILVTIFLAFGCPEYLADLTSNCLLRSLTYHCYHANIFHLAANCLSIWYVFKITPYRSEKTNIRNFFTAFVIASITYFTATRPVVGISNILFAVLGLRTPSFKHPWWRHPGTLVFFAITLGMLALPQFSAITHIVSFVFGTAIAAVKRKLNSLEDDYRHATSK